MPGPRRPAHTRPPTHARNPLLAEPVTALDSKRWQDSRRGISKEELATRENVKLSTIQKSLDKMDAHAAAVSQESVEMATRQLYLESLAGVQDAIVDAIAAMKTEQRVITNKDTGETEIVEIQTADHATRMKAIDQLKGLLVSIQPKTPLMTVDARTQINNPGHPQLGSGSTISTESIIRQIRAQPNFLLTDGQIRQTAQQTNEEIGIEIARDEEDAILAAEEAAEEEAGEIQLPVGEYVEED
jgi:hypothetical protein